MNKMIAVIAAVMMIVAIPIGLAADGADADTGVTGQYSVYAFDGSAWSSDIVDAYDAAQAVQASEMWATGDSMVAKYTEGDWVTYNYDSYGNINTFMGKSNANNDWSIFVYVGSEWTEATVNLGSYKCFSDYNENYQTANVMLYHGDVTLAEAVAALENATGLEEMSDITEMDWSDDFKVTFHLAIVKDVTPVISGGVVTEEELKSSAGVTIEGCGSDCYLALIDAITSSNVVAVDAIPGEGYSAYGWIDTIFGLGTVQTAGLDTPSDWTDDAYSYWCVYDDAEHLADFVLGAYSPLACAGEPFSDNTISLIYEEVAM